MSGAGAWILMKLIWSHIGNSFCDVVPGPYAGLTSGRLSGERGQRVDLGENGHGSLAILLGGRGYEARIETDLEVVAPFGPDTRLRGGCPGLLEWRVSSVLEVSQHQEPRGANRERPR